MDLIAIAKSIESKIKEIDKIKASIRERGTNKAQSSANYEKQLSITMIKLRNGIEYKLDSEVVTNPPATVLEKIARGICFNERLDMEESEALYKSAIINLEATMAQMNALQSLSKYLE